jgi:3-hydroxy-3-methylglutaryl CoA synthase/uncharacterized OB-fold protein
VYIPASRIERRLIGAAWASPSGRGQRAVAASDEDSVTLAVTAGLRALEALPGGAAGVQCVFFATPNPPMPGVANGVIVAAALGLGEDVAVRDVSGGRTCGLEALQSACEAVDARAFTRVVVVVADCTIHEPGSPAERLAGDAAVAFVVQPEPALAEVLGWGSHRNVTLASWRTEGARYARAFEPRLEQASAQTEYVTQAARQALGQAALDPGDLAHIALSAAAPMAGALRRALGADGASLLPGLGESAGDAGAADPALRLVQAMAEGQAPGLVLIAASGQGAVAAVVRCGQGRLTTLSDATRCTVPLSSYAEFAEGRGLYDVADETDTLDVSPVAYWRAQATVLRRAATACLNCGFLQFPPGRRCPSCGERGRREPAVLSASGEIYTFTNDHLVRGRYSSRAQTRCVVDMQGGGRIYTDMAEQVSEPASIGMPVELVLRLRAGRRGFRNYGWKARPRSVSDAVA